MSSTRLIQRLVLVAGAGAVVVSGALVACSAEKEKPTEPANSAPAVAPTEKKNVGSFAPEVTAKPAPTAIPGIR